MKNRRANSKIKRQFQNQVIFNVVVASFCLLNLVLIWVFAAIDTLQDVSALKTMIVTALAIGETGGLFVIYHYMKRETHRIAGPVYKLEQALDHVGSGNLSTTIQFRKDDYFRDTGDLFNSSISKLRTRIGHIRHVALSLEKELISHGATHGDASLYLKQLVSALDSLQLGEDSAHHDTKS
ncbi:MAG: methyl-accepting chemotaxis protein [Gammaproteobacteria bacterium]|nr:methyl-accepting chemotaxis protein [Gammaproteobacteria bacterium]